MVETTSSMPSAQPEERRAKGSLFTPPPFACRSLGVNLGARLPPARSSLSILTQFLSQTPPFASRPPFPKSRSPGRQETAGPGRVRSSTVSSLSQQDGSWGCGSRGFPHPARSPPYSIHPHSMFKRQAIVTGL